MSHKHLYRLPTEPRTVTEDQSLWAHEWNALADKVVAFFPGYRVSGMDPGVLLFPQDGGHDSISLSLRACLALINNNNRPPAPAPGHHSLIFSDQELDSLKKILRQVYISDFGGRIVDDAKLMLSVVQRIAPDPERKKT